MRAVVAALNLLGPGVARAQVVSPGKLSDAHADLDGSDGCASCHGTRGRVEPRRCLDCHEVLRARIDRRAGYHARLGASRCGSCHQEHRGRSFDIIKWPTTQSEFPHERAGYRLRNAHVGPSCRDCHRPDHQVDAGVRAFPAERRNRTWLGLSAERCGSCHADAHDGELGDRCGDCHDDKAFTPATGFAHGRTKFPLTGGHAGVDCGKCHPRSGAAGKRRFRVARFDSCASCHDDPHAGAMTPARARPAITCESCHVDSDWQDVRYAKRTHSPRTMPLIGGHAKPACTDCHGGGAKRTPAPSCTGCHRDVHDGKFGADCRACHGFADWRAHPERAPAAPAAVSSAARLGITPRELARVAFHDKTRYPLTGLHVRVDCAKCHPRARAKSKRRGYNRYVGIAFERCDDCHADEHQGQLARDGATAPRCETCHSTDGWPLTSYGVDEHDRARMPLRGAHRATACARCHAASRPDAERFTFAAHACADCHDDPHGGQFAGAACADCHDERAFRPSTFDHARTRLALGGAHAATACASCHRSGRGGVVGYRGVDPRCAACHRDEHEGQFARPPPARPCSDCHTDATFEVAAFDHVAATGYPLTGGHAAATCADCHHDVALRDGQRVTMFRLGDARCNACHRDQHAERRGGRRTLLGGGGAARLSDCGRCHQATAWRALTTPAGFDHGTVGYTLRGAHRSARCADCHTTERAVSRACDACHDDRHDGALGSACAECHGPETWEPSAMLARHQRTRLPLTGGHALADCTSCHPRANDDQFTATAVDCVGCHAAEYTAPTTHPDHVAQGFGRDCEDCHRPAGWSPAYFAHTTWPLTGAHRVAPCNDCHDQSPVPRDCVGCHAGDRPTGTSPDHGAPGFPSDCGECHSTSAWEPADFPDHDALFPISSGPHDRFDCADCHPDPTDLGVFTCTTGSCHSRGETDDEHDEEPGYVYESNACLMCHPRGRE